MLPPRTVLAAVDFSEPSRAALSFAARFATHCRATLHVLHAQDPSLAAADTRQPDLVAETRDELLRFVRPVLAAPDAPCVLHVVAGRPTSAICNIADRERADVIVLGTRGMTGPGPLPIGSIAEGVLRCADVSVLVVPASWTPPHPDTADLSGLGPVVVGIEPAEPALSAAVAARTLAAMLQTSIELVHVVADLHVLPRWHADATQAVAREAERVRSELLLAVQSLGADAASRLSIETGPVAETLAAAVAPRSGRHALLVLGRRTHADRGGAPGSVAYRVLMLAQVPVLVHLPDPEP